MFYLNIDADGAHAEGKTPESYPRSRVTRFERTRKWFRLRIQGSNDREVLVTAEDLVDAEMVAKKICAGGEKVGSVEEVTKAPRLRDV